MKFKNNKLFALLIIILSSIFTIIISETYLEYRYKDFNDYFTLDELLKISEIGIKNHHIREINKKRIQNSEIYYSHFNDGNSSGNNIGLFGDSWIDYIDLNKLVFNNIKAKIEISNYINGGTTSYAPSLIEVQFNDILEKKNMFYDLVLVYLDQTDFMDEVCDYNKRRIEDSRGKLIAVLKPTALLNDRWSQSDILARNLSESKLINLLNNFLYKYYYKKTFPDSRCLWKDINKFMVDKYINQEDFLVFEKNLLSMITTIEKNSNKVLILTHKHKMHYTSEYQNDINSVINEILYKSGYSKKVEVIDLSLDINQNNFNIDKFSEDGSHPSNNRYNEISKKISDLITTNLLDQK